MFEYAEHNKWVKAKAPVMSQYVGKVKALLADSAARGFDAPPPTMLKDVFDLDEAAKIKLTDINGELYKEQTGIIFQEEEFALNLAVEYAKLVLAKYVQDLLNALTLEKAEMDEQFRRDRAYTQRLEADVNKRNYALIIGRANIESLLIDYKTRELEAQRLGMDKELELIAAQMETVKEKLRIIPWLQELILKERAIIDLERQRAVILQAIIIIKEQIVAAKEGMIPLYFAKASATKQLATAITAEVQWKKALIELGFERILVEDARAGAVVSENDAKAAIETLRLAFIKHSNAVAEARSQFDISLSEYSAAIARQINELEKTLKEVSVDLRINTSLEKLTINIEDDINLLSAKIGNLITEIASSVDKITGLPRIKKRSKHINETETETESETYRRIYEVISG
jgi:hypothetical protein